MRLGKNTGARDGPAGFIDNIIIKRPVRFQVRHTIARRFSPKFCYVFQVPEDIFNPSLCYSNIFAHSARHTASSRPSRSVQEIGFLNTPTTPRVLLTHQGTGDFHLPRPFVVNLKFYQILKNVYCTYLTRISNRILGRLI
ncbi:uncharacterized protein LACBIDRAFT_324603 [Laccaria bicolor S238N-H82]|uniref:Predicted protein n=1 Tax=Laccaria bicolor (strain S238N-H82 / ATCC MYA-4686) TaxID=486041 RepID=B0D2F7_LACBS|nr:uncharacterized protein LACBIDRAFT_324603 [Laccaria bicolor S238N-H82]EDR11092.1 predicted protein [Laccaria bicolor S238N-H82]|eukprot:XP_001878393.1 predicted protein [Laccaria bicolor S238N-H82]